jgi:LytS/YehU family sensor histidine kinase
MENIRNRISPHFMFNILNAVLPALRQHEEWTKPLQLLVQSIRNNLIVSEKMAVPLKDELNMVQNFIDLRKSIGSENAEVIWMIDEDVDLNILVPSICMQIPVENALKYAFEEYKKENRLFIKITKKREESISTVEEFISIIIEDNGIGLEKANIFGNTKGTGNGLKILYKTIELLNVKNVQKIAFNIRDKRVESPDETGTIVSIVIPVNYQYKI